MSKEWPDLVVIAISGVGFLTLLKPLLFQFPIWVWSMFFRPPKNLKDYGQWAVVTGCTEGVGKALTFELVSKGLDLVLVGRNPTKLQATEDEIRKRFSEQVGIKKVEIDLAKLSGEEVEAKMREGIEGLDVGVLVNNAGVGSPYPQYFHESELWTMETVNVNLVGLTWATKAVLPGMMKKRKGAIVNIGSGSSVVVPSWPLWSVYSATKAYVQMLSRSMSLEYQKFGIDIQCQVPLLIATKMIPIPKLPFFIPPPEDFSSASARWIGYNNMCEPYWKHTIQSTFLYLVPDAILSWVLLRVHLFLNRRGLRSQ